jgi:thiamine-monophosphate kinase
VSRAVFPSSEFRLLESLKPLLNFRKSARYPLPIGDDAALRVCRKRENLVFTADSFVENVHFSFTYMTSTDVGYKAMAINISDCAAMGSVPDGALVQIIFPEGITAGKFRSAIHGIYRGVNKACRKWDFPVIGGNLAKGPCWIIDITLIGRAPKGGRLLMRKGARANDGLWVTGMPGESGAGLAALRKWGGAVHPKYRSLAKKHIRPEPRIGIGIDLCGDTRVHAAIDISDGISKECRTLAYENDCGLVLDIGSESVSPSMRLLGAALSKDWHTWFFNGGEDYELLFAAAPGFSPSSLVKKHGTPITRIGTFKKSVNGVFVRDPAGTVKPLKKGGWDHLRQ